MSPHLVENPLDVHVHRLGVVGRADGEDPELVGAQDGDPEAGLRRRKPEEGGRGLFSGPEQSRDQARIRRLVHGPGDPEQS
ncbi:MAG: hypothetical protein GWN07_35175, partial [Actinobacteria bacterium]|nr:hypothetical protein [Actinomycetota bacterium]NIX24767.1 hypothetical protein [Actinomycetota bacterium]